MADLIQLVLIDSLVEQSNTSSSVKTSNSLEKCLESTKSLQSSTNTTSQIANTLEKSPEAADSPQSPDSTTDQVDPSEEEGYAEMSSVAAARRSPRTVANLCGEKCLKDLGKAQSSLVISLAYMSGWSADLLSVTIKAKTSKDVSPEAVYQYVWRWIILENNNQSVISQKDHELMKAAIKESGIEVEIGEEPARPLHNTYHPRTVPFVKTWSPKSDPQIALCKDFTVSARDETKVYLITQSFNAYGSLTPTEKPIVAKFGIAVAHMLQRALRRWSLDLKELLSHSHPLRAIVEKDHVALIMKHLDLYQQDWEDEFGKMEVPEPKKKDPGAEKSSEIHINSTGYGCKVLLGLMMADRIHVVERSRQIERERICFDVVPVDTLDEDHKDCYICIEQMGVKNPEGVTERALRLAVCCSNIMGEECLKVWLSSICALNGKKNDSCPMCRQKFPEIFLKKLFQAPMTAAQVQNNTGILQSIEDDGEVNYRIGEVGARVVIHHPSPSHQSNRVSMTAEEINTMIMDRGDGAEDAGPYSDSGSSSHVGRRVRTPHAGRSPATNNRTREPCLVTRWGEDAQARRRDPRRRFNRSRSPRDSVVTVQPSYTDIGPVPAAYVDMVPARTQTVFERARSFFRSRSREDDFRREG